MAISKPSSTISSKALSRFHPSRTNIMQLIHAQRTFFVPMKSRCSTACAIPGISSSSEKLPTFTFMLALALSVSGSWTRSASSLFPSSMTRYDRSSNDGFSSSSVMRRTAPMTAEEEKLFRGFLNDSILDKDRRLCEARRRLNCNLATAVTSIPVLRLCAEVDQNRRQAILGLKYHRQTMHWAVRLIESDCSITEPGFDQGEQSERKRTARSESLSATYKCLASSTSPTTRMSRCC